MLLLYGIKQAVKPATPDHPFGFGLRLYFWAFVVAILIFGLGSGLSIWRGIDKIQEPEIVKDAWVNYLVLGLGIVFEGMVWWVAFRTLRSEKGTGSWLEAIRASKDPTIFTILSRTQLPYSDCS